MVIFLDDRGPLPELPSGFRVALVAVVVLIPRMDPPPI